MPSFWIVPAILFASANALANEAVANCASGWVIKDEKLVSYSPKVVPQHDSMWCYLHATDSLIKQHVCKQRGGCGAESQPSFRGIVSAYYNRPSHDLRDYIQPDVKQANKVEWRDGGYGVEALRFLSEGARVANEACAPTAEFTKWASLQDRQRVGRHDPINSLRRYFQIHRAKARTTELSKLVEECERISPMVIDRAAVNLAKFTADAVEALTQSSGYEEYVHRVLVPERCEAKPVEIPKFAVKVASPESKASTLDKIREVLDRDKMVMVNLCANTLENKTGCSGHAAAVAGRRQKCCGSDCQEELKFLDSDFIVGKSSADGDFSSWVGADRLATAIMNRHADSAVARGFYEKRLGSIKDDNSPEMIEERRLLQNLADDHATLSWIE